jgi:hypothetical protein
MLVTTQVESFVFPLGIVEVHCGEHVFDIEDPTEAKLQQLVNQTFGWHGIGEPKRWVEFVTSNSDKSIIIIQTCS